MLNSIDDSCCIPSQVARSKQKLFGSHIHHFRVIIRS